MKKSVFDNQKMGMIVGVILGVFVFLFLAWKLTTPSSDKPTIVSLPVVESDHIKGNEKANITIIEYADFQCPACKTIQPVLKQVLAKYGDKLKFVYRHFPLDQHKYALSAASAAEAAGQQGKFFEYGESLYEGQDDWQSGKDIDQLFDKYAQDLGLDLAKFNADRKNSQLNSKISTDQKSGINVKVDSTPTFFINGMKLKDLSLEGFEKIISTLGVTESEQTMGVTIVPQNESTNSAQVTTTIEITGQEKKAN